MPAREWSAATARKPAAAAKRELDRLIEILHVGEEEGDGAGGEITPHARIIRLSLAVGETSPAGQQRGNTIPREGPTG